MKEKKKSMNQVKKEKLQLANIDKNKLKQVLKEQRTGRERFLFRLHLCSRSMQMYVANLSLRQLDMCHFKVGHLSREDAR